MPTHGRFTDVKGHDRALSGHRRGQKGVVPSAAGQVVPLRIAPQRNVNIPVGLPRREIPQAGADVARVLAASAPAAAAPRQGAFGVREGKPGEVARSVAVDDDEAGRSDLTGSGEHGTVIEVERFDPADVDTGEVELRRK